MMRTNDEIVNIITKARKKQNMSTSELARQTGVAKSSLSRYENRTREFPLNQIDIFAKVLHLTPEFILGFDNIQRTIKNDYNFFDTTMSAGALTAVDPFTRDDVEQIAIPDMIMGKYAGDKDIFVSRINGESMNNVLPNNSMVAVKKYDSIHELCDNDIVVFQDGGDMTVKRFHDNKKSKTIMFVPDSKDDRFEPILYRYEDIDNVKIIGKVIVYIVRL